MISPDLLVYFTAPPKLNPTTGVCYAAKQFLADLRVPFLFTGARPIPGTCTDALTRVR